MDLEHVGSVVSGTSAGRQDPPPQPSDQNEGRTASPRHGSTPSGAITADVARPPEQKYSEVKDPNA